MAFWSSKKTDYEQTDAVIRTNPGITPAELARRLNKHRSTIGRRLTIMEQAGYLYSEDEKGRLYYFGRRK